MKGFIKKDLLLLLNNIRFYAILFLCLVFLTFNGNNSIMFLMPYISVSCMATTFSYDSYNKWDFYAASLPHGRENVVKAKYVTTIILTIIFALLGYIFTFFASFLTQGVIPLQEIFLNLFLSIFLTIFITSLFYPFIFKLGIEKARIGIFVFAFFFCFIGSLCIDFLSNHTTVFQVLSKYWQVFFFLFTIFLLGISYKISKTIYLKKEL